MRRKSSIGLILISILLMAFIVGYFLLREHRLYDVPVEYDYRIMGIPVVENTDFLQGKERYTPKQNPGVYFEDVIMPYSSEDNTIYLSQDYKKEAWEGVLSTKKEGTFLCMFADEYWNEKAAAIKENHVFTLWLVTKEGYYEFAMEVSGMPVISIDTKRIEEQEPVAYEEDPDKYFYGMETLHYGDIRVFNPNVGTDQYEIIECGLEYHKKGASSSNFDKKSYSLKLLDAKGENLDVSLLGMRSDNSWKLNSLITDPSRIREITAAQIWEQFDLANDKINEAGPRLQYVELILDNDYRGVYGLVEPVDEKKLQLDDNDVLYKVITNELPSDDRIQESIDNKWKIQSALRIRYPKTIADYETAWYPVRDYLNTFLGEQDIEYATEKVYVSNAVDMMLFITAVAGSDNHTKNRYLAADVEAGGSYVMRQVPWDLDITFGQVFNQDSALKTEFEPDYTMVYEEEMIPMLMYVDYDNMSKIIKDKWQTYRESFLQTDAMIQRFQENRDYLIHTGAVQRENERWPDFAMDTDIEYLIEYQRNRMDWADGYIDGYTREW